MTDHPGEENEVCEGLGKIGGGDPLLSRRQFLKLSGVFTLGISTVGLLLSRGESNAPLILMEKAEGILVADPTRCVACRRCELACTEFNDGKASSSLARVKVNRNLNFGPQGAWIGRSGQGNWGNGLAIPDLCLQCPHPVPCANACPNDAIVAKPPTYARVVDSNRCIGCKMCQRACPWAMMSFDSDAGKATKCFLCDGAPRCVEACPAGALQYLAWRDLTMHMPPRLIPTAVLPPEKAAACQDCHRKE